MTFVLVTGNADKAIEAERILGWRPEHQAVELTEIQSLDLGVVLEAKLSEAYRRLGRPVVVEDTSLELAALGGFPGPLVKWLLEAAGAEGLARCGLALGDPRVAAVCGLAYFDGARLIHGRGRADGVLVLPPRGANGFGWDPVFQPAGESRTFAELAPAEKDRLGHRGRAWRDFGAALEAAGVRSGA